MRLCREKGDKDFRYLVGRNAVAIVFNDEPDLPALCVVKFHANNSGLVQSFNGIDEKIENPIAASNSDRMARSLRSAPGTTLYSLQGECFGHRQPLIA